jgi:glycosyltransferase involved in cell wall biosynthesis
VHLTGTVDDAQLRWLYANARGLVAASYEDFGLTPLEAGTFGKPTVALRRGGYLDTVEDGLNGLFFGEPTADALAEGVRRLARTTWDGGAIEAHTAGFGEARFAERLRQIVDEEMALLR